MISQIRTGIASLEAGLASVRSAQELRMPLLFGKSKARYRIAATLSEAQTHLSHAHLKLGDDASLSDAQRAVALLADSAHAASVSDQPHNERNSAALIDAVAGAEDALKSLKDRLPDLAFREQHRLAEAQRRLIQEQALERAAIQQTSAMLAEALDGRIGGAAITRDRAAALLQSTALQLGTSPDPEALGRIAAIARLPDEQRPKFPNDLQIRFKLLDAHSIHRTHGRDLLNQVDALRASAEVHEIVARGTATREELTREFDSLVLVAGAENDLEVLRRLATLESLPKGLRPKLPTLKHSLMELLATHGSDSTTRRLPKALRKLRKATIDRAPSGSEALVRTKVMLANRRPLKAGAYRQLLTDQARSEEMLGIDLRTLLADGVRSLRTDGRVQRIPVERARELLEFARGITPSDDIDRAMLGDVAMALDRNIDRHERVWSDGYDGWSNFAELGQAAATADAAAMRRLST
jgi:hypothetical protein